MNLQRRRGVRRAGVHRRRVEPLRERRRAVGGWSRERGVHLLARRALPRDARPAREGRRDVPRVLQQPRGRAPGEERHGDERKRDGDVEEDAQRRAHRAAHPLEAVLRDAPRRSVLGRRRGVHHLRLVLLERRFERLLLRGRIALLDGDHLARPHLGRRPRLRVPRRRLRRGVQQVRRGNEQHRGRDEQRAQRGGHVLEDAHGVRQRVR
mmetsp:Transcript_4567/g.19475  ORF Transcript_4567/g.19475 Transcript_4567/m.19475 type:complete len:209 (-) Transcript_4567:989-1615(-)